MSIAQSILAEFDQESKATRALLERVPDEKSDWKPHDKSMTLGRLAAHVAESTAWAGTIMETDELDFDGDSNFEPLKPGSTAELLELYDREVADFNERVAGYSDEQFLTEWTMRKGDTVIARMPRLAMVRAFVLNHIYHHRGQLTVYLRLLGVPLPMIYGPTADDSGGFA